MDWGPLHGQFDLNCGAFAGSTRDLYVAIQALDYALNETKTESGAWCS